jgi:cytochrome P450
MTTLPPGPREPGPLQTARWIFRPVPFLDECKRRFGDVFTLRLSGLGLGTFVFVSTPELIKEIFTADEDRVRGGEANRVLEPLVGAWSVLLLDKAPHLRQRRLLLPPFHGERMQAYGEAMRDITDAALDRWPLGAEFALHPPMQSITLDVILRCCFGIDQGAMSTLRPLLVELFKPQPLWVNALPFLRRDFPLSPFRAFLRVRERVDAELYRMIRARRTAGDLDQRKDILSLLLSARDEQGNPMSDVELRDELITMLVAGHETTATSLSWAFSRVLDDPAIGKKILDELDAVVGQGPLDPAQLPRLEYLEAVCKETLRLRPILPLVVRNLHAPLRLGNWDLPSGIAVAPCIFLAHHREANWPEPTRFRPERFVGAKIDPYAWLPFGGGTRRCIGMAFALYEMKIVLATTMLRVKLRLGERPTIARRSITFAPSNGTLVRLESRQPRRAVS